MFSGLWVLDSLGCCVGCRLSVVFYFIFFVFFFFNSQRLCNTQLRLLSWALIRRSLAAICMEMDMFGQITRALGSVYGQYTPFFPAPVRVYSRYIVVNYCGSFAALKRMCAI